MTAGGMLLAHRLSGDGELSEQTVQLSSLNLTATVQDADGVAPDTQFLLSSATP